MWFAIELQLNVTYLPRVIRFYSEISNFTFTFLDDDGVSSTTYKIIASLKLAYITWDNILLQPFSLYEVFIFKIKPCQNVW